MPLDLHAEVPFDFVRAPNGRVRAIWRLLAFFALFAAAATGLLLTFRWVAYFFPASPLSLQAFSVPGLAILDQVAVIIAAVAATGIMLKYVDREDWSMVMMGRSALDRRQLLRATILGATPVALAGVAVYAAGWLALRESIPGSSLGAAAMLVVFLVPAALGEELLARGYPFTVIRQAMGPVAAIAITAILFGVLHARNPGANDQSIFAVMVAGVFLAVVLLATQSLYAATLAHAAWNVVMAAILHTPVSGLQLPAPDYRLVDAGPDWATGGYWGPEAGVPAVMLMLLLTVYLVRVVRSRNPLAFTRRDVGAPPLDAPSTRKANG